MPHPSIDSLDHCYACSRGRRRRRRRNQKTIDGSSSKMNWGRSLDQWTSFEILVIRIRIRCSQRVSLLSLSIQDWAVICWWRHRTGLLVSESCRPASRLSIASAVSILQLEEETSHILRIRTLNTFWPPTIIPPDDNDDGRFDGPPSPGHVRDPRFPSPHIVPTPAPPRSHLPPPSHASSLDSVCQGGVLESITLLQVIQIQ